MRKPPGMTPRGWKPRALVQVPRVCVAGDDGVELQDAEAVRPALPETVGHQLFADVQTARFPLDRVAGVADVSAAADVVGMQDVQTVNMAGLPVLRDGGTGLLCEKRLRRRKRPAAPPAERPRRPPQPRSRCGSAPEGLPAYMHEPEFPWKTRFLLVQPAF